MRRALTSISARRLAMPRPLAASYLRAYSAMSAAPRKYENEQEAAEDVRRQMEAAFNKAALRMVETQTEEEEYREMGEKIRNMESELGKKPSAELVQVAATRMMEARETDSAFALVREMLRKGVDAKELAGTYEDIIESYVRLQRHEKAMHVMEMQEKLLGERTNSALHLVVRGFCVIGAKHKALEVMSRWAHQKPEGHAMDVATVNQVVSVMARMGDMRQASYVLKNMEEKFGVKPDLVTISYFLHVYLQLGDVDGAKELVGSMEERFGLAPSKETYHLLAQICLKHGSRREGVDVILSLPEKGLVIDSVATRMILENLYLAGEEGAAERFLEIVKAQPKAPQDALDVAFANARCAVGDSGHALSLLEERRDLSFGSQLTLFESLFAHAKKTLDMEMMENLVADVNHRGVRASKDCLSAYRSLKWKLTGTGKYDRPFKLCK